MQKEAAARRPRDFLGWADHRGIFLWSAQRAIGRSVERNKRTAVRAGHSVGKSYEAAVLTAWWTDTRPDGLVITTAPSVHQVRNILWHEVRRIHGRLSLAGRVLDNQEWKIGADVVAFGRKPPDQAEGSDFDSSTFQGYHRPGGVLMILDEAGGIPEWLWTAAETVTTSDNSRVLAIGNPDNPGSHFARVCEPGYPGWAQHKISVFDSPAFTGEAVPPEVAAALVTRTWQEERLAEWTAEDHKYISKILAEFPKDHPMQVVQLADLIACQFAEARTPADLLPVELGVDVGGGGDLTVVRERTGVRAGRQWTQVSDKPEMISRLILRAIRETGATSVKVDSIGVGFNVVGELRNMAARGDHQAAIHGVNVGEAARDPREHANQRAEIWWEIGRVGSQKREWDLSQMEDRDATVSQLLIPRYFETIKGQVQVEPKKDIRKRAGISPDKAEALLLAYVVPPQAGRSYWEALAAGKLKG